MATPTATQSATLETALQTFVAAWNTYSAIIGTTPIPDIVASANSAVSNMGDVVTAVIAQQGGVQYSRVGY